MEQEKKVGRPRTGDRLMIALPAEAVKAVKRLYPGYVKTAAAIRYFILEKLGMEVK